jgi:signal transduction histidine kinase
MRIRSLQARSVLAAALAVLIALVVVGIGVDVLVGRHLRRALDATLRQRAVEVAQLSASAPALVTAPGSLDSPLGGTHVTVQVIDRRGRIVARSLSLGGRVLPAGPIVGAAISRGRPGYANARLGDEHLRLYAAPLANFGGAAAGGAVVVAASTQDLRSTLASLHAFLLVSALAAAALAALALTVLMRRALQPLGRLADAAAEIERTGDPARRLPEPASADEVGRLAATLNAMLASLERARESERRFLADASHELRTPLTALRGNVSYLAGHGATPELVADLEQDAERLVRLADDLLALSREEAAEPPRAEVRLDELARAAGAGDGSISVDAPDPVRVRGDRAALERALANLIQNARRHGPAGGEITVAAERVDGLARLSVRDEGPGLDPAEAERAFERFRRGAANGTGSGLGLAIVRATAERHGGRAYAEGSCFTVELPALTDLSESAATTEEESPKGST